MSKLTETERTDLERFARKTFIVGEVAVWVGLKITYAMRGLGPNVGRAASDDASDAFVTRFCERMGSFGGKS